MGPPALLGSGCTGVAPCAARPLLCWVWPASMRPGGRAWDEWCWGSSVRHSSCGCFGPGAS
eukprot:1069111-Pyramimonas_sp.AAC.1